jgi:hypothetical protein
MNYIKDIFIKGRYHIYIGFAAFIEGQRRYLLPHSNLYKNIRKTVAEELSITNPDQDLANLSLESMNPEEINYLKSATKKKVE